MKKNKILQQTEQNTPSSPYTFHQSMERTLGLICSQEADKRGKNDINFNSLALKRRTLTVVLVAVLAAIITALASELHHCLVGYLVKYMLK